MMKYIKYFLLIITLILILVLVVLSIINFTNLNYTKSYITDLVSKNINRKLYINGDIKLKLIPPHLTVKKIQLKNPPWAKQDFFIEAEQIDLILDIKSLFFGEIEITKINLKGSIVNLIKNIKNQKSWTFDTNKKNKVKIKEERLAIKLPFIQQTKISLSEIKINYIDEIEKQKYNIELKTLVLINKDKQSNINIEGSINQLNSHFSINTEAIKNILVANDLPLSITGEIGNIDLKLDTRISLIKNTAEKVDIAFDIKFDDYSTLKKFIEIDIPPLEDIVLKGSISLNKNKIAINLNKAVMGKTEFQGDITYLNKNNKPDIKSNLEFKKLDLQKIEDIFQKIKSDNQSKTKNNLNNTQTSEKVFSDDPLDLAVLNKFNASLKIKINDIDHDIIEMKNLYLDATLKNGLLNIEQLDIKNKRNETLWAKLRLNTKNENQINLLLKTDNIKLGENEALSQHVTGATTNINIELQGKGKSIKKIMGGLNGRITVNVGKGELKQGLIDFIGSNVLLNLVNAINPLSSSSTTSNLECAVIRFDIKDGVATANKSLAMQTDKIQIISSGIINLKNETVELMIKPEARSGVDINLNSLATMVKLGGPINKPTIKMNLNAKDTAVIYSYFATGGATFLAKTLFDSAVRDKSPCKTALLSEHLNVID